MAHEEALVITTAPSERQVKNTLWREIREIWERNKDLIGGKLNQTSLELSNKRFAYGFSTNTPERFQGFHSENVLIIVDEASGVREFVYEAILGLMTSRNAKILLIGNPSSLAGTFYDAFHKNRKHWKTIHIAAEDTPNFRHSREGGRFSRRNVHPEGTDGRVSPVNGGNVQRTKGAHEAPSPSRSARGRGEQSETQGMPTAEAARPFRNERGANKRSEVSEVSGVCQGRSGEGQSQPITEISVISGSEYIPGLATPEWAESILEIKGEESASYQIRVLGEFPDEADDTLIPLKHIENAVEKFFQHTDDNQQDVEAEMGLDVARFGDDQTVAIVRRGNSVIDLVSHRKSDLMNTTGKTLEIAKKHDVNTINIDEVGLGSAVVDRIQELKRSNEVNGIQTVGVNGGNKAQDTEKFFNLRTQMFDGLRQRFADGEISIPNDPELISQLASITYIYNSRGQLQIETKQQIRDSGRQSPDKADALALAFTAPKPPELRMWILSDKKTEHAGLTIAQRRRIARRNRR